MVRKLFSFFSFTNFTKLFLIFAVFIFSIDTFSAPKNISFQSRIYKPDGSPLEAASVQFKFSLMNPLSTCVIYSETFSNINLTSSAGNIVLALGGGTRSYPVAGGMQWFDAFNNSTPSYTCQTSGTYSPVLIDPRRLIMQFNDGSGAGWQTMPPLDINSVPYAMFAENSEKLENHPAADFVLASALPTCSGSDVLTYNGTTFSCTPPTISTLSPSTLTSGGASAGQVLKWNGSNWVASNDNTSTGTVSSVSSTNLYLSVAGGTSTPALTVNVGTAANTVAAGNDARFTDARAPNGPASGDLSGTYPGPSLVAIGAGGTGTKITYDTKGRVTSSTSLISSDVTAALGYTPTSTGLTNSFIYVGNASNVAVGVSLSGDATISNLGILAINSNAITNSKINDVAFSKITGKPTTLAGYTIVMTSNDITTALGYTPGAGGTVTGATAAATSGNPIIVSSSSTSPSVDITRANGTTNGYLASSDFTTFSNKLANFSTMTSTDVTTALTFTPISKALSSGQIFIGNGSNFAQAQVLSGDATMTSGGILTINSLAINNAKINDVAFNKITGKPASLIGHGITMTSNDVTTALGYTPGAGGGTVGSVTAASTAGNPITVSGSSTSPSVDISRANGTTNGYLASSDFTTFNNKLANFSTMTSTDVTTALTYTPVKKSGDTMTGTLILPANGLQVGTNLVVSGNNVGIGTTSPAYPLSVAGDVNISGNFKINGVNIASGTGSVTGVTAASTSGNPITVSGSSTSPSVDISRANGTTNGYLASSDFTSFSNKLANFSTMTSTDVTTALTFTPISKSLSSGQIFVGNGSNFAQGQVLSGDATITSSGILTVNPLAITNAKINDVAFSKITGKPTTLAGYAISMTSTDVTTALSYTPVNRTGDTMTGPLTLPANGLTVGSNLVVVGNNVGIGTTTPAQKLSVVGIIESTSGGFKFPDGTTQATAAGGAASVSGTTNYLSKFSSTSSVGNSIVYDNGTNVGIGTTTPSFLFDVIGSSNYPVRVKGIAGSGLLLGSYDANWAGIWSAGLTPNINNYAFLMHPTSGTAVNSPTGGNIQFNIGDVT